MTRARGASTGQRRQACLYWRYVAMLGEVGTGQNNVVIAPAEGGTPLCFGVGGWRE